MIFAADSRTSEHARRERARRVRAADGGFTLIEMMVVIAIIALMLAAGTFTLRNLMRSNLRSAASRTSAAIRFAFDRSMVTSKYLRLAIDFDKGEVWLEESNDRVTLRSGRAQHVTTADKKKGEQQEAEPEPEEQPAAGGLGLGLLGGMAGGGGGGGDGSEEGGDPFGFDVQALMQQHARDLKPAKRRRARFKPLKGPGAKRVKLSRGIEVDGLMTPRMEEPARRGIGYVYFFPQGHAEPAIIQFRNRSDDYYSVVLHPLTGRAIVWSCRYRFPEEFGDRLNDDRDPCESTP